MLYMKRSENKIKKTVGRLIVGYVSLFFLCAQSACTHKYQKVHDEIVVVDGHNDVIYESILSGKDIGKSLSSGHTDIPRLKKGGVNVQVFAVWSDDSEWGDGKAFKHANDQIDALEKAIQKNQRSIALVTQTEDIPKVLIKGKIAAVIGVEGGNMIESSTENLEALYQRGVRYLTLTWNYNLPWVTSAAIESDEKTRTGKGLSSHGRQIIKKMNELGMMIDLSHGSRQTFYDVLEVTEKPILVSHSNAYALTPHYRNLDDEQLHALKENGGVVGVNFYSGFLDSSYNERVIALYKDYFGEKVDGKILESQNTWAMYDKLPRNLQHEANTPIENLMKHIDYLVDIIGIDHVAVGSDFDGIESPPQGLEDVSKFPNLTKELLERGYSRGDIEKIMGLNFLRVWKENENR